MRPARKDERSRENNTSSRPTSLLSPVVFLLSYHDLNRLVITLGGVQEAKERKNSVY